MNNVVEILIAFQFTACFVAGLAIYLVKLNASNTRSKK